MPTLLDEVIRRIGLWRPIEGTNHLNGNFLSLFIPKLWTVLHENYGKADLRADVAAGLTVAIVALPLSMAIAIASGVAPEHGLYTAIVGGFIVSALGGSRFQIGGPAGAFIVLVWTTVQAHGFEGLVAATVISDILLISIGSLGLGSFIKFIPYPVMVGFAPAIAIIILASQIKDALGLTLSAPEPGPLIAKIAALHQALPSLDTTSTTISSLTVAIIALCRRFRPHWPGMLSAVAAASILGAVFHMPLETIGSRFGGIPQALPIPGLPHFSADLIMAVLPAAFSFALLGSIESLLSATVADSMTGARHRSNAELIAQGFANIASAFFSGICVTGAIARTATNIRAGARGPVAGVLHSIFLLLFMIVAAPLAKFIPLAALAGVLVVVCWTMAERHAFVLLLRSSRSDRAVLLATFLLTILYDLTAGILAGCGLGALFFLYRIAQSVEIEKTWAALASGDPDIAQPSYDPNLVTDPDIIVYRISGAFFFGSAASVSSALEEIAEQPKAFVIDFSQVPLLDSTAAATINGFTRNAARKGVLVLVAGATKPVRRALMAHGMRPPRVRFRSTISAAVESARRRLVPCD